MRKKGRYSSNVFSELHLSRALELVEVSKGLANYLGNSNVLPMRDSGKALNGCLGVSNVVYSAA